MILTCIKDTVLRNGEQTVTFKKDERLNISNVQQDCVILPCKIEGYKKWIFIEQDWRKKKDFIQEAD